MVPGERTPLSDGGGHFPFWSPDGSTVYYWGAVATSLSQYPFIAARLERDPTAVVQRDTLFIGPFGARSDWALHPEGDRLIVPMEDGAVGSEEGEIEPRRFIVALNWFEELLERMGER